MKELLRVRGFCYGLLFLALLGLSDLAWAARTVQGTIRGTDGSPVVGALVEALDADIDDDDFMGADITDSNGRYEIHYAGGHWDPAPDWWTIWRADIFIRVSVSKISSLS